MKVAYPFHLDGRGLTAMDDDEAAIRAMIEQVLFTQPGERVNRPSFGSGIMQLVFAPNGPEAAAATQALVQGALQEWLGDVIEVESLDAVAEDGTLRLSLQYVLRRDQERRTIELVREV